MRNRSLFRRRREAVEVDQNNAGCNFQKSLAEDGESSSWRMSTGLTSGGALGKFESPYD